jgi:hypothetical protein
MSVRTALWPLFTRREPTTWTTWTKQHADFADLLLELIQRHDDQPDVRESLCDRMERLLRITDTDRKANR